MEIMATYVTLAGTRQMLQWPVETWATLTMVSCSPNMTLPFSHMPLLEKYHTHSNYLIRQKQVF